MNVALDLTPAQARCVNSALALLEADVESMTLADVRPDTMRRTRRKVWTAMEKAGEAA